MGEIKELNSLTRGRQDAVLIKIGEQLGTGTKEGVEAFLSGKANIMWVRVFRVFYFNMRISPEEVINQMQEAGYHPASMKELITYSDANPKQQKKHIIFALGSKGHMDDFRRVNSINRSRAFVTRDIYFHTRTDSDDDYGLDGYHFLGVHD